MRKNAVASMASSEKEDVFSPKHSAKKNRLDGCYGAQLQVCYTWIFQICKNSAFCLVFRVNFRTNFTNYIKEDPGIGRQQHDVPVMMGINLHQFLVM